jgi:acylphosphatase
MIHAEIWVSGVVQGVFYRAFVKARAKMLSVTGYIENLPDKRVHAVFEGEKGKVDKLVDFASRGPPSAEVDDIEIEYSTTIREYEGFKIKGVGLFGR